MRDGFWRLVFVKIIVLGVFIIETDRRYVKGIMIIVEVI